MNSVAILAQGLHPLANLPLTPPQAHRFIECHPPRSPVRKRKFTEVPLPLPRPYRTLPLRHLPKCPPPTP